MHFPNIDLNLLVLLDQILEQGGLSRAAEKLEISQPAASRMLARLRRDLSDPILIPSGRRTILSQRAESMRGPLRQWLDQARLLLQPPVFEPSTHRAVWRIHLLDYLSLVVLPPLMAHLQNQAPLLDVVLPPHIPNALEALRTGDLDLALGYFQTVPDEFCQQPLFEERFVCLTRVDHPMLKEGRLSLERFCALSHALITVTGTGLGVVDQMLQQRGLTRRVALRLPHFLAAPVVVAQTDLVLTLPARVAYFMARKFPLHISDPPLPLERFPVTQVWHRRSQDDAAQSWLRAQMVGVAV
ncbi:MAG: LysR family transcriptional regulator [Candidatus Eremiobacteraeota bacterium]|nr:LysR family transcriptional regulator [Candidatus Eremiobacteraeota bacterium]